MGCGSSQSAVAPPPSPNSMAACKTILESYSLSYSSEKDKDFLARVVFLSKIPLFKRLPKTEHAELARAFLEVDYKAGDILIKQGDLGEHFFVLFSGSASVYVDTHAAKACTNRAKYGQKLATLHAGDYFGENTLLRQEPRAATVVADEYTQAFQLSHEAFAALDLDDKLILSNRKAVRSNTKGSTFDSKAKSPTPKTEEERLHIEAVLRGNKNLQAFARLDSPSIHQMIERMWKETIPVGSEVIRQGDLDADYFYVVQEGSFTFSVDGQEPETPSRHFAHQQSNCGVSFGELALLYSAPRAATVTAATDAVVWVLDRRGFKAILREHAEARSAESEKYLKGIEIFAPLLLEERKLLAAALQETDMVKGDVIYREGDIGDSMYILYEGAVKYLKDGHQIARVAAAPSKGQVEVVGESALLQRELRANTVVVTSKVARAFALERSSLELLVGPLKDLLEGQRNNFMPSLSLRQQPKKSLESVPRSELTKVGLLGCGGFGVVELWLHEPSGESYAMKSLNKGYIVKHHLKQSVLSEKNILAMVNSPFITKLFATYNAPSTVDFLLEACLGGELYSVYIQRGFHGKTTHARYYVASVLLALEHLHERHIIYRDLKPENLLLTDVGTLKLADMGLAKFVVGKSYTTCGTPDYFAPEMINCSGHTKALDWWTLGILIFELLAGYAPFRAPQHMQIYAKVIAGINEVPFPSHFGPEAEYLIEELLRQVPGERLSMRPGGIGNIQQCSWYKGFDWASMRNLRMEPPYKPQIASKTDLTNFVADVGSPKVLPYEDDGTGWDLEFES